MNPWFFVSSELCSHYHHLILEVHPPPRAKSLLSALPAPAPGPRTAPFCLSAPPHSSRSTGTEPRGLQPLGSGFFDSVFYSRSIHDLDKVSVLPPFYSQMTSEFKDVPHRLRPFVRTVSTWLLLPGVRSDAPSAGTRTSVWTCVSTSGDHPAGEVLFLNVLNISRTFGPLFPLEVNGASGFSTSWTTLRPSVLSLGHPAGVKWHVRVVRACISDDSGSWGSSNEPVHVFFGEKPVQILGTVFIWVFYFLSYKIPLYILTTSPLSDVGLADIFSHSKGCLCTFLMTSFEA